MDFRLLGPVEARVGGVRLDLGPAKQRCVLAVLLEQAGRAVTTDVLVGRVWGATPPSEARGTLYSYLTRLRRILRDTGAGPVRTGSGYVLDVPPDRVDLHRFTAALAKDSPAAACAEWRGEPLYGVSGDWAEQVRAGLRRRHVEVLTAWAGAELAAGGAAAVVDRLGTALDEYPHAEGLIESFLRALHADGRTAEALEFFEAKRAELRAELGVQPGVSLQEIHRQLLAPAPVPAPPAPAVPDRLPAAPDAFAGRAADLAQLDDAVASLASVIVISGTGGVGKTALALTWGRRVAARFPDGLLHVNLRGYAHGEPMRPIEALSTFLRALGVAPEDVPLDDASAAALYRSLLAGRRMLVLLDDAGSAEQVRPLLPGTPGSVAVVTSRDRLGDLVANVGARRVCLGPLAAAEAAELLTRTLGEARVSGDEAGAAELVTLCGSFPLALRVAAAHLAERPGLSPGEYARELRERTAADPAIAVRATFALSYRRLPAVERRVFRLLGLHPGPDFTAETAAALTGLTTSAAKRAVRLLASANLVEQRASSRFAFHDLLRHFAAERAQADEPAADRAAAEARLADHYLRTAEEAARHAVASPPRLPIPAGEAQPRVFADDATALRWLDSELGTLVALAEVAERDSRPEVAWLLSDALRGYFQKSCRHLEWQTVARAGEAAAERHGDPRARTVAQLALGRLNRAREETTEALHHLEAALSLAAAAGWTEAEIATLVQLGAVHHKLGRGADSMACLQRAADLARACGDRGLECSARNNLGAVCREMGSLVHAELHLEQSLELCRGLDDPFQEALVCTNLALALLERGEAARAVVHAARGLELGKLVGHPVHEANFRVNLAAAYLQAGRPAEASEHAEAARVIATGVSATGVAAEALSVLAAVAERAGDAQRALVLHRRAVAAARTAGDPWALAEASTRLAERGSAAADIAAALQVSRAHGFRGLEARALVTSAEYALAAGDFPAACDRLAHARTLFRATGYALGDARAAALSARLEEQGRALAG